MDTRIALGVQPLRIPDQSESLQKALTLNALMGQSDLQGLQFQEGQRTLRQNNAMDEAARSATSTEDYLTRLRAINPNAAIKLQKDLVDQQKTQSEVTDARTKQQGSLTAAFASLPPDQQALQYPQLVQQFNTLLNPGQKQLENEPWNPSFLPNLKKFTIGALQAKDAAERQDYQDSGPQPVQPGQPTTSPVVKALQGDTASPPVALPPQGPPPMSTLDALSQGAPNTPREYTNSGVVVPSLQGASVAAPVPQPDLRTPQVDVNAKPGPADDLRVESARLRALNTEVGDKRAAALDKTANEIESRVLQEKGIDEQSRLRQEQINLRQSNQKNQGFTNENKLSDDYRAEPPVKSYRTVQPVYNSMKEAAGKNTAASDLNLVYGISKIFDPDSVVREGEQVMVVNAGGLPSKVQSWIGMVNGGQKLSDALRKEIMAEADSRIGSLKQAHDQVSESYRRQAKDYGLNPDNVVRTYDIKPSTPKGAGPRGVGTGTQADPFQIKGEDGWSLVPKGQYYTAPDGSLRQKQ